MAVRFKCSVSIYCLKWSLIWTHEWPFNIYEILGTKSMLFFWNSHFIYISLSCDVIIISHFKFLDPNENHRLTYFPCGIFNETSSRVQKFYFRFYLWKNLFSMTKVHIWNDTKTNQHDLQHCLSQQKYHSPPKKRKIAPKITLMQYNKLNTLNPKYV